MKLVPNTLSRQAYRQILKLQKNSPRTLFIAGVVGGVATVALTVRATLKLEDVLEEHEERIISLNKNGKIEDKKDLAYVYAKTSYDLVKLYSPVIIVGSFSIAALTGSHHVLSKRNASLTAAYATIETAFANYRKRVVDEFGEEKDLEFKYGVEVCEMEEPSKNGPVVKEIKVAAGVSQYARYFDQNCAPWSPQPEYNLMFLRAQQSFLNDRLIAHGHVFLNEVYDALDIPRSKAGAVVGWVRNGADKFIDFGMYDNDRPEARSFVNGDARVHGAILLDFNVDGLIYDKI